MKRLTALTCLLPLLAAPGCARRSAPQLTILCGGSFRPPMEKLGHAMQNAGIPVQLSFGQSEDLLPQLKLGKIGDLFVTHDPYLDYVKEAGAYLDAVEAGYVSPVLVVRKGNPKHVRSLADLARPGLKTALPDPAYSTCGQMLFTLLEKRGLREGALRNARGALFRSHSETANAIELGAREAGVMWNGTAHEFRDKLEVIPTPYEYSKTIRVWVIGLGYSKQPGRVRQALDFLRQAAPPVFAEYGYVK